MLPQQLVELRKLDEQITILNGAAAVLAEKGEYMLGNEVRAIVKRLMRERDELATTARMRRSA